MAPKRKAPTARRSARGDAPSSSGATVDVDGSDLHVVKRPRIEGEDDEITPQDGQHGQFGEGDMGDRAAGVEAGESPTKRRRGRTRGGGKKQQEAEEAEEVHAQASLRAPPKRGRGRHPKVRTMQEDETSHDRDVEDHHAEQQQEHGEPAIPEAQQNGEIEEPQDVAEDGENAAEQLREEVEQEHEYQSEHANNEAFTPQNDGEFQHRDSPEAGQHSQHPSPDDVSPSPNPEVLPEHHPQGHDLPPPNMAYGHAAPPPPPPYGYPYGYHYPAPPHSHPYPPAPPPPGMEYSSSFATVNTSQGGSFHSTPPYSLDANAPAGNPFPPPPPNPHMYHPYGTPMINDDRDRERQPHASGSDLHSSETPTLSPVTNENPPPGHPIGVPYTGPDGRKRVPVRQGARSSGRGEHVACHFCRGRKLKCDGRRPTCSHCALRSLACSYDGFIRRRGPGKKEKNSRRSKSTPSAVDMSVAALASAGMHMGTIDIAGTPPPESESPRPPSPEPLPEPPTSSTRPPRRRRSKYNQPQPDYSTDDPNAPPKPRPYIGPMPTPDPPRGPTRRRRIPVSAGVLRLNQQADEDGEGSGSVPPGVNGGLKPGAHAYAVGSNERLTNVGGFYYAAPAGAIPPPPPPGQFYNAYVPVQSAGDEEEGDDEQYQQPEQAYGHPPDQHAWPAEPPGHI
ncbi:hypothetical protein M422DRAFT_784817 [Sphaerobolus stellatus SS14]|uniref:Zn(2)-C6 fungal-type domain-containing protein n=1 Tax=Sphaerobolus stellatus (strain SS14) TaxID=990650 RepID=A0A0C9UF08_SPHS4|nr:hypothetical protein M422DRAFT_784817 [Sphaerobolus stellatus SS14]